MYAVSQPECKAEQSSPESAFVVASAVARSVLHLETAKQNCTKIKEVYGAAVLAVAIAVPVAENSLADVTDMAPLVHTALQAADYALDP